MADGAQLLPNLCQKAEFLPKEFCEEYAGVASVAPSPQDVQEIPSPSSHNSKTQGAYEHDPYSATFQHAMISTSPLGLVAELIRRGDWEGLIAVGGITGGSRAGRAPLRTWRRIPARSAPSHAPTLADVKTAIGSIRGKVTEYEALMDFRRITTEQLEAFKGYLSLEGKIINEWVNPGGLTLAAHSIKRWLEQKVLDASVATELKTAIEAAQKLVTEYRGALFKSLD